MGERAFVVHVFSTMVLLASDDWALADRLAQLVLPTHFELHVVESVSAAEARLRAEHYVLVIVDVRLADGSALPRLLEGDVPVIVIGSKHMAPELRNYVQERGGTVIDEPISVAKEGAL